MTCCRPFSNPHFGSVLAAAAGRFASNFFGAAFAAALSATFMARDALLAFMACVSPAHFGAAAATPLGATFVFFLGCAPSASSSDLRSVGVVSSASSFALSPPWHLSLRIFFGVRTLRWRRTCSRRIPIATFHSSTAAAFAESDPPTWVVAKCCLPSRANPLLHVAEHIHRHPHATTTRTIAACETAAACETTVHGIRKLHEPTATEAAHHHRLHLHLLLLHVLHLHGHLSHVSLLLRAVGTVGVKVEEGYLTASLGHLTSLETDVCTLLRGTRSASGTW